MVQYGPKKLQSVKYTTNLPVKSAASAIKKVEYDMSTKRADSSKGKSLSLVNLVRMAVNAPITEPMKKDIPKMIKKFNIAPKKAEVSKLPSVVLLP